jgi:hypothetical protein
MHSQLTVSSPSSLPRFSTVAVAAALVLTPLTAFAQSVGLTNAATVASSGESTVMISARSLDAQCRPAPAGTAYLGGVAVELKNSGGSAISAKGVHATLSLSVDNKLMRKIALSNPAALAAGGTAFAAKNGKAQVWYPITAQVVTEYMKAHNLSSPPASIPVTVELDSVRAPATANLDTVSLNVALANDATLCGFLKAK